MVLSVHIPLVCPAAPHSSPVTAERKCNPALPHSTSNETSHHHTTIHPTPISTRNPCTTLPSLNEALCRRPQGNHILIVWSTLPVATTLTSFSGSPESTPSAPFTPFLSLAPPAGCLPQASVATKWLWASTVLTQRPVESSQTRIVLSSEEERRYLPEGWKARARTQLSCPA